MLVCHRQGLRIDVDVHRYSAVRRKATRLLRGAEWEQSTGFRGSTESGERRGIIRIDPHSATECSATGFFDTTFGILRTMMAESLLVFVAAVVSDIGKKTLKLTLSCFVGHTGIGRTTNPGGSVVLESPVSAKEMTALCFLMGASDKEHYQRKGNNNNNVFWGG